MQLSYTRSSRVVVLAGGVEQLSFVYRPQMRERDERCADARDGGSAARPSCSVVLLDGDLCIIFDAYRCAVDASAGNAIRSSADASRCSESYLPLRHDCRRRMMFERCLAMFRKLVDHFNAPVVRVIALRLFPGSHVQEHKSARAQERKSARAQERKSAKMLKCKSVRHKIFKDEWAPKRRRR
ncbi:hypothetical protein [Xanthomonas phaseoli]|uniref:hypothetical protein n=1 Tax=Xanthomonas phaseoli TaxID=1985254 RepID=UPI0013756C77|nr:hypothetical protein [Xanthomonas phaseoli]